MNAEELKRIAHSPEGQHVEFKAKPPEPGLLARIVCGFLNSGGGRLIIGVRDAAQVVGVANARAAAERIRSAVRSSISPPAMWTVEETPLDGRDVIVVNVPEGVDKPYVAGGSIWVRRGTEIGVAATPDEISSLISKRVSTSQRWERQIAAGVERADLDEALIEETAHLALESDRWAGERRDTTEFLSALGLAVNERVTNAALVCFGKQPTRFLPQARVRLLVMPEGKTGDRYALDKVFEASLLRVAEEIPSALTVHAGGVTSQFVAEDWKREDRPRFPMAALREGVMNALIHRDYASTSSITVSILPDSLVISNPGGLPPGIKPADLKHVHPSVPRNPDMAHVCFVRGLIEKIGRGTQRIVEDCRAAGLREPRWESTPLQTTLTFFAGGAAATLSARQEKILVAVRDAKQMTALDVAKLLGVTDRTARNDLQALVDGGWLVRKGKARSTRYSPTRGRER
ncbi:MAG: putative DNA binding domain-containing protein [Planctomycetes bacterium]|nr:putative DNA binding domain-containing protein [Planctomycetota bacterium]MBI3843797.1 putative DNA binding domain-containing protein [Planctomycetota bacterium]